MTAVQKNTFQHSTIGSKLKESMFNKILGPSTRRPNNIFGSSAELALSPDSYPFVVSGSSGSGRGQLSLNLAINSIAHRSPFVYIDGSGDTSPFWELYAAAEQFDQIDDLYIINTLASSIQNTEETSKISHTFDPLNALIGNEQAFEVLFGQEISNVIHSLCQCKKDAGEKVSFDDLSNYINMSWLKDASSISLYSKAQNVIDTYLDVYDGDNRHFLNIANATYFRCTFEHSACYSIDPEIDFDEIYKQGKYLLILLPALDRDPEALNVYATTMLLLLEQSRIYQKTDGLPTEFIRDVFARNDDTKFFVESPKKSLTVYSLKDYHHSPKFNYPAQEKIAELAKSFVFMKQEGDTPSNIIKHLSRFNNFDARKFRDDLNAYHPFEGLAIGNIERLKYGEPQGVIEEPQAFKVPHKILFDLSEDNDVSIKLSRKSLLN